MRQILKSVYLDQLKARETHTHALLQMKNLTKKDKRKLLFKLNKIEAIIHQDIKVDEGVQWHTHGAEDFLCTQWNKEIWSVNEVHPEPVTDTHPNCVCTLERVEIVEEFPFAN